MTMINGGNTPSLFQSENTSPTTISQLITDQLDPTLPSVDGLIAVTDPLIPIRHSSARYRNFDPDLYDLRQFSHLSKLLNALTGAAGSGGLRKQAIVARISGALNGTHFLDLDSFYGAIFNLNRTLQEEMPTNDDGTQFNPMSQTASSDLWDDVQSRDARYRSRILQFAKAVNMGATYPGLRGVAEAVISAEVDIIESWIREDADSSDSLSIPLSAFTYDAIAAQFTSWDSLSQVNYAYLEGNQFGAGNTLSGNRGELIVIPRRALSDDEKYQLAQVLRILKPSHTQITINSQTIDAYSPIAVRSMAADSENWNVVSSISPNPALDASSSSMIYSSTDNFSPARPAFSQSYGASWSYSPKVASVQSYTMENNFPTGDSSDEETITYTDNYTHTYAAVDAVLDSHSALTGQLASDGVLTAYPYSSDRIVYTR